MSAIVSNSHEVVESLTDTKDAAVLSGEQGIKSFPYFKNKLNGEKGVTKQSKFQIFSFGKPAVSAAAPHVDTEAIEDHLTTPSSERITPRPVGIKEKAKIYISRPMSQGITATAAKLKSIKSPSFNFKKADASATAPQPTVAPVIIETPVIRHSSEMIPPHPMGIKEKAKIYISRPMSQGVATAATRVRANFKKTDKQAPSDTAPVPNDTTITGQNMKCTPNLFTRSHWAKKAPLKLEEVVKTQTPKTESRFKVFFKKPATPLGLDPTEPVDPTLKKPSYAFVMGQRVKVQLEKQQNRTYSEGDHQPYIYLWGDRMKLYWTERGKTQKQASTKPDFIARVSHVGPIDKDAWARDWRRVKCGPDMFTHKYWKEHAAAKEQRNYRQGEQPLAYRYGDKMIGKEVEVLPPRPSIREPIANAGKYMYNLYMPKPEPKEKGAAHLNETQQKMSRSGKVPIATQIRSYFEYKPKREESKTPVHVIESFTHLKRVDNDNDDDNSSGEKSPTPPSFAPRTKKYFGKHDGEDNGSEGEDGGKRISKTLTPMQSITRLRVDSVDEAPKILQAEKPAGCIPKITSYFSFPKKNATDTQEKKRHPFFNFHKAPDGVSRRLGCFSCASAVYDYRPGKKARDEKKLAELRSSVEKRQMSLERNMHEVNAGHPSDESEGSEIVEDDDKLEEEHMKATRDLDLKKRDLVPLPTEQLIVSEIEDISFAAPHAVPEIAVKSEPAEMDKLKTSLGDVYTGIEYSVDQRPPVVEAYSGIGLQLAPVVIPPSASSHNIFTTSGVTAPSVTVPDVTVSDVTVSDVTVPDVTVPDVTVPDVTVPDVTTSTVTVPDVKLPAVTVPDVKLPTVTVPTMVPPTVAVAETTPVVIVPAVQLKPVLVPTMISQFEDVTTTRTVPLPEVPHVVVPSIVSGYEESTLAEPIVLADVSKVVVPAAVSRIQQGKVTPVDISSVVPFKAPPTDVLTEGQENASRVKTLIGVNEAKIKGITAEISADEYERKRLEDIAKLMRQENEKKLIADSELRTYMDRVKDVNVEVPHLESAKKIALEKEQANIARQSLEIKMNSYKPTAFGVEHEAVKRHSIVAERKLFIESNGTVEGPKIVAAAAASLRPTSLIPVPTHSASYAHTLAPPSALKPLVYNGDAGVAAAAGSVMSLSAFDTDDSDDIFIQDVAPVVVEDVKFINKSSSAPPTSTAPTSASSVVAALAAPKIPIVSVPSVISSRAPTLNIIKPAAVLLSTAAISAASEAPTAPTPMIPSMSVAAPAIPSMSVAAPAIPSMSVRAPAIPSMSVAAPVESVVDVPAFVKAAPNVKSIVAPEIKNSLIQKPSVHVKTAISSAPSKIPSPTLIVRPSSSTFVPGAPFVVGKVSDRPLSVPARASPSPPATVVLRPTVPSHIVSPSRLAAIVAETNNFAPSVTSPRLKAVKSEFNFGDENIKRAIEDTRKMQEDKIAFDATVRKEEEEKKMKLDDDRKRHIENTKKQFLDNERNILAKIAESARLHEEKKAASELLRKAKAEKLRQLNDENEKNWQADIERRLREEAVVRQRDEEEKRVREELYRENERKSRQEYEKLMREGGEGTSFLENERRKKIDAERRLVQDNKKRIYLENEKKIQIEIDKKMRLTNSKKEADETDRRARQQKFQRASDDNEKNYQEEMERNIKGQIDSKMKEENERRKREEIYKENERKLKVDHERKLREIAQFVTIQESERKLRVELERKRVEDIEKRMAYENEKTRTELNVRQKREAFERKIKDKIVRHEDQDHVARVKVEVEERQREDLEMKSALERRRLQNLEVERRRNEEIERRAKDEVKRQLKIENDRKLRDERTARVKAEYDRVAREEMEEKKRLREEKIFRLEIERKKKNYSGDDNSTPSRGPTRG